MKEYILRTDKDFLIKIADNEIVLNKYNSLSIKIENNENDIIKIYPLFSMPKSLPYCICLSRPLPNNIKVTQLEACTILDINPRIISTCEDILQQLSLNYNNSKIFISVATENIFICNNQQCTTIKNNGQKFDFEIKANKLIGNSEDTYIILDLKNFNYRVENYQKINKNGENIEFLCDLKDFSGHLMVNSFNLNNNFSDVETTLYYKENKPNKTNNPLLIPIQVLESIKIGDLDLAKSYIANTIILNGDQLKKFFGDFDNYELLNGKYYLIKNGNAFKELNFIINNNLIVDIEDRDLNI